MSKKLDNKFRKKGIIYKICAFFIKMSYKKTEYIGLENLPKEPSIIAGNHAQLHGPINAELYFPTKKLIWCDGPMMNRKEFPKYAYSNFFGGKPNIFQKMLSHMIAPIITNVFRHADALPVYRDMRIMKTYKSTTDVLEQGVNVVILPECPEEFNEITNKFNEYFVDVARFYYKHNAKELNFVPMYYSKELKKTLFGKPIKFDANAPIETERKRICEYLMGEITTLAKTLPPHKVIPFNNVPKKDYKMSK
ncbi:MAG: hypothetical protein E7372_05785 [Clostridiales bacterium]|nr:hypothetical protein [Clostridiales bacterium]